MHARRRDSGKTSLLSTFLTGLLAFAGFLLLATLLGHPAALAQNDSPLPPSTNPMPPPPPGYGGQQEKGSGSIKASVDLVVLHVTVTDESGQFIGDLKKGDFRVSRE